MTFFSTAENIMFIKCTVLLTFGVRKAYSLLYKCSINLQLCWSLKM